MNQLLFLKYMLACCLFCAASCTSRKNYHKDVLINAMKEDLENNNTLLSYSSYNSLSELIAGQYENITADRARTWLPKAEKISHLEDTITKYIKSLQDKLIKQKSKNHSTVLKEFLSNDCNILYERMTRYKSELMQVDTLISLEFNTHTLFESVFDKRTNQKNEFGSWFFDVKTIDEAVLMLLHFENRVRILANKTIIFCRENTVSLHGQGSFESYSAIIGQSSSVIRKGEVVEITAGVGAFSRAAQPTITVNGKKVDIGSDGAAVYRLPKATTPGKYFAKVVIEFKDENGEKKFIKKEIEYTVLD